MIDGRVEFVRSLFDLLRDKGVIDRDEYEHIVSSVRPYSTYADTVQAIRDVIKSDFIVRKTEVTNHGSNTDRVEQ